MRFLKNTTIYSIIPAAKKIRSGNIFYANTEIVGLSNAVFCRLCSAVSAAKAPTVKHTGSRNTDKKAMLFSFRPPIIVQKAAANVRSGFSVPFT